MTITQEISLSNFEFWSGAKDNAAKLSSEQLDQVEAMLEDMAPEEGWTDSAVNDLFWFDFEQICEWLGIDDDGNEIGSAEWAEELLKEYNDDHFAALQLGNAQAVIDSFLEDEYYEDKNNKADDVKYDFKRYVLSKWKEMVANQIKAWHSDIDEDEITQWLDDNYDDEDDIPDYEGVIDEFKEYVDGTDEEEEEEE